MDHTNVAYKPDSDTVSLGDLPSNKQYTLSPGLLPGYIRRISDHSTAGRHFNSGNISSEDKNKDEQQVPGSERKEQELFDEDPYYSMKNLRSRRRGKRDEDSGLSNRVKRFYEKQDDWIDGYQRVHDHGNGNRDDQKTHASEQKRARFLTKVSLGVNICLFILKVASAVMSKSLSIVSSVIDSAVDLATSVILFWAWRAIKKRDGYRYPQGRTRLEPVAIVILSVIMCAVSVLVIYESINTIVNDAQYFSEKNTTRTLDDIDMSAFPVATSCIVIVSKAILFFVCHRVDSPTTSALAEDHRNDVASNIVALICGLIGSFAYKQKINQKAIVMDPVGAIVISIYIIIMWIRQANSQIKRLSGHTADPKFLSQITWLTFHHSPLIKKIDTVRAFYFGTSYLVEVDIVLPENMLLKEAHDIGEELQQKIEALSEVERAFVHLDYEFSHNPKNEHKIV
ncbi:unnamed protein product [Adineta ricciae]|uniref:Cation efflux protein cytoplasmic domain-containing protein n=1 Tax=Adineta ricciae TaxID=249248 RepID=A0A813VH78_ADIRI|nr:unnamed protein product [Adineta ricciae]